MGGTGPIGSPGQHVTIHPPFHEERSTVMAQFREGRARNGTANRAAAQRGATNPRGPFWAARDLVSLRYAHRTICCAGRARSLARARSGIIVGTYRQHAKCCAWTRAPSATDGCSGVGLPRHRARVSARRAPRKAKAAIVRRGGHAPREPRFVRDFMIAQLLGLPGRSVEEKAGPPRGVRQLTLRSRR